MREQFAGIAAPIESHPRSKFLIAAARLIGRSMAIASMLLALTQTALAEKTTTAVATSATPPWITPSGTIDLRGEGFGSWIQLLSFSPNSRYLAIIDNPTVGSSSVIIWDLQLGKEQTRITGLPPYGGYPQVELLWSPDGKYITFGTGLPILFWDPLSGKIAKELRVEPPVRWARYNKDGTKLLVNREPLGGHGGFRIYDTRNWTYRDYGDDGLLIEALSWTADDMVLVAGEWPKFSIGRTLEGIAPQMSDALARLIDPSGRQPPRTVLLASGSPHQVKTGGTEETVLLQSFWPDWAVANYNTNRISLGVGKIIDAGSLEVLNFASDDDIRTGKIPAGGQAFSPDGNFLYLLGISRDGNARSLVLNAATGKPVGTFPGGHRGLAASPDGHRIAVGNGRVVNVYDVR